MSDGGPPVEPAVPAVPGAPDDGGPASEPARSADLLLAHVHLRLGSLALARAELETLAGRDALDVAGLVDLAEARWRTGDVAGAGEAAAAALGQDPGGPIVALVVAAEAALSRGRPSEARRYAMQVLDLTGGAIDPVFAGMPRGPVWPADATTRSIPAPTLFDAPAAASAIPPSPAVTTSKAGPSGAGSEGEAPVPVPGPPGAVGTASDTGTLALWEGTELAGPSDVERGEPALPSGVDALETGRAALDSGDPGSAAMHLALAIRLTPALAPVVLEAIDGRGERELALVRGDAYRLLGRETDALRAFADAARRADPTDPLTDAR